MRPLATALVSLISLSMARADERPTHVVAGEPAETLHVRLDSSGTFGIGGQSFLGALLHGSLGVTLWDSEGATGSFDAGLALGYHNEPVWLAPWLSSDQVSGAGHRVQLLAVAGHTFHMLPGRELSLSLQLYGGWSRWISSYAVDYDSEDVHGEATIERDDLIAGGQLTLSGRVADVLGLHVVLGGPFPTESSYVIGMFHVGLGLSFHVY